ncbi:Lpd [Caligus rogercresseyi]|uniref:Lpd n=1 Tax=Caligus rogercresseyi TaxID=217165 RepID=A0A7T8K1X1_CALRO|nr:Lpd [Caligus rogercresseyi]
MVVIGAGVIGLELGSVYKRLGAELGAAVQSVEVKNNKAKVTYKLRKDDSEHVEDAEWCLWPPAANLSRRFGARGAGVELEPRGQIKTDAHGPRLSKASTPSVTPSPARCSRIKPKTKAWAWQRFWRGKKAM